MSELPLGSPKASRVLKSSLVTGIHAAISPILHCAKTVSPSAVTAATAAAILLNVPLKDE
eukprot:14628594-Ditylum_brightwellii.AAC.1